MHAGAVAWMARCALPHSRTQLLPNQADPSRRIATAALVIGAPPIQAVRLTMPTEGMPITLVFPGRSEPGMAIALLQQVMLFTRRGTGSRDRTRHMIASMHAVSLGVELRAKFVAARIR